MDDGEHNHRPYKKIRLEDTLESRNISIGPFQHDQLSQGRDHSVYTQVPPRSINEKPQNINPFISTCKTEIYHRLTFDYQSTRCAELNSQASKTSRSITSCSHSASCTPSGTPLEYNGRVSTRGYQDQVCFGMVGPHSAAQYSINVLITT